MTTTVEWLTVLGTGMLGGILACFVMLWTIGRRKD